MWFFYWLLTLWSKHIKWSLLCWLVVIKSDYFIWLSCRLSFYLFGTIDWTVTDVMNFRFDLYLINLGYIFRNINFFFRLLNLLNRFFLFNLVILIQILNRCLINFFFLNFFTKFWTHILLIIPIILLIQWLLWLE